ncbi:Protein NLP6 [Camellia lanceoleosa]|uniref:Protein NLP6 n=1 Tax=Camellia lanceoleosa TaxID=1840588 RepID=A0ACC0FIZ2_9ERIC|nr:Protein NLP6 [Camellia lanceoleosa]
MAESDGYRYSPSDYGSDEDEEGRVTAYFPDDFKQYVDTQLNRCPLVNYSLRGWVFWSREDDQSEHPPNFLDLKKKIKDVLRNCLLERFGYPTLFQFWAPTMTMDGRSYLTTQNQPFALSAYNTRIDDDVNGYVKGLCGYRMISMDYKFYMDRESSDEQLGVPGRVFNHGFPEFSHNVECYSIKEYPLRNHALLCQVKHCWAIPVFDPSTHFCVGVLEIVSTAPSRAFLFDYDYDLLDLLNYLEEVGLESSSSILHADHQIHRDLISGTLHCNNVEKSEALDEINKVLEVVHEVHGLHFAQVWAPCRVDWRCRALVKGDIFHVILKFEKVVDCFKLLGMVNVHLRKGQGVVGRAFYSHNVLLCKDVTQLSIIDYPLAHYARDDKLGCCFAICLQSSCTGNDTYVLECFMPPSNKDYYGNQHTALRKILETLKKNFRTFKLASGEELGGHLYIEEISFQNGEKLDSVQMSQTTKSLPRLEPLQSGGEMTQMDLSNQQSMDALNNESNVVSAERSNIDVTCSQEKGKTKRPKRVHNKTRVKIEIPLDDILQNSNKRIQVAADNLQVSKSTLKRVCRDYGFPRWPPRKKKMVGSSQPSESSPGVDHQQIPQLSSDQPFSQASTAVVVHGNPRNTVIQEANVVTVKAKYINNIIIKFPLSLSSGLVDLQQQIANRLHLEDGTYYVKYKDEVDDFIVIACDQDLQDCISTCRLLGTSIVVFIESKSTTIDQMMASFEKTLLVE